jgi:hypothetical protein
MKTVERDAHPDLGVIGHEAELGDSRPNGPAMAAIVAAGFGSLVLGAFTTAAEASEALKGWLKWRAPVGPLSGKTGLAVAGWIGAWLLLGFLWRRKEVDFRKAVIATAVLIGLGLLGTFPSFFEQFTAE